MNRYVTVLVRGQAVRVGQQLASLIRAMANPSSARTNARSFAGCRVYGWGKYLTVLSHSASRERRKGPLAGLATENCDGEKEAESDFVLTEKNLNEAPPDKEVSYVTHTPLRDSSSMRDPSSSMSPLGACENKGSFDVDRIQRGHYLQRITNAWQHFATMNEPARERSKGDGSARVSLSSRRRLSPTHSLVRARAALSLARSLSSQKVKAKERLTEAERDAHEGEEEEPGQGEKRPRVSRRGCGVARSHSLPTAGPFSRPRGQGQPAMWPRRDLEWGATRGAQT